MCCVGYDVKPVDVKSDFALTLAMPPKIMFFRTLYHDISMSCAERFAQHMYALLACVELGSRELDRKHRITVSAFGDSLLASDKKGTVGVNQKIEPKVATNSHLCRT